jgi:hypothetical protein
MSLVTRTLHRVAGTFGAIVLLIAASAAAAEPPPIGQVKTVSGSVSITRDGARLPVNTGDPLFVKDIVSTGDDGSIGITYVDNTVMSAGPNSEIEIEEYRFDSSNFNGAMLTNMRKGTLSIVSGDIARSAPGSMKVKTPKAILGVRGTTFVVEVDG